MGWRARVLGRAVVAAALGVCGAAMAGAQQSTGFADGRQVLVADDIRRAGVLRIGDLPLLFDRWDRATIDGVAWQAAADGTTPLDAGAWTVLVDGVPADVGTFGALDLNRLGLPLQHIDSLVLIDTPSLDAGRLTPAGVIHIHTIHPRRGASAGAWFTTGSEIGDPGPFAFTPDGRANVDRLGHEYAISAGYGAARWWADASLNAFEYPPTDPALLRRYSAANVRTGLRIEGTAPAARIGLRLLGGVHTLAYRASEINGFVTPTPLPAPLASLQRTGHMSLSGTMPSRRLGAFRYYVTRNVNRTDAEAPSVTPSIWRTVTWTGGVESHVGAGQLVGARVERTIATERVTATTIYGQVRPAFKAWLRPTAMAALTLTDGDIRVAAALTERRAWTRRMDVHVTTSYARQASHDLVSATAGITRQLPDLHLTLAGQWRAVRGLSLTRQALQFVPSTESFEGSIEVEPDVRGQVAGIELGVAGRRTRRIRIDGYYRLRGVIAGRSLRRAWTPIPRHLARATVAYVPVPGFDLQLTVGARSATIWPDYRLVERESGGVYRARLPAIATADATMQKALWRDRLRLLFGVRNLTGAPVRYHPAGATTAPLYFLQVESRLP